MNYSKSQGKRLLMREESRQTPSLDGGHYSGTNVTLLVTNSLQRKVMTLAFNMLNNDKKIYS